MRKLLGWLVVTLGIAALVRKLRRREPELAPETPPATTETAAAPLHAPTQASEAPRVAEHEPAGEPATEAGGDPAAELRERLARSRAEMPSSEEPSVEGRRASVHDQGRAALDEMQQPGEPSAEPGGEPTHEER